MRWMDDMPVGVMTIGDLRELIEETLQCRKEETKQTARRYVYGLHGISELFGVSHKTAQDYKNTFLKPAVMQSGRKIVVDADLAMELFAGRKNQ